MEEIRAHNKFNCPSCGAEAVWNPTKQMLVCNYCGTSASMQPGEAGGDVRENCLLTALANIDPDHRGWATATRSVKCQSCQAITVFEPSRAAQRCDFCGSASIIPVDEQLRPIRPESVLEFKVSEVNVRESIRQWYGSRWFAPNRLGAKALTDTVKGIYIPYWTFDSQVSADWTAMSGDYYYENESYTDSNGNRQTRRVRKVRWYPSSGHLDHFFDDELVPATRGVDSVLLKKVEPFPTLQDLKPYDAGFLSGWIVEQYQIDLVAAARHAQDIMEQKTRSLCASQVPGDTHRDLEVNADFSAQTFKHILVPVWLLSYDYRRKSYQVVVNGYTGAIAGKYPKSWVKITLLILAILAVIGGIAAISNMSGGSSNRTRESYPPVEQRRPNNYPPIERDRELPGRLNLDRP